MFTSSTSSAALPGFVDNSTHIGTFAIDAAVTENNADTINTGSLGWSFTLADNDPVLQSLAQGETITQVYTVTITDNNGAPVSQDVTVTITGTNDAPTITSGTQTGAVTEIADNASGENIDTLHASGTVTFTDVDLIDTETSSIVTANTLVDPTLANGNTLTQAQQDALVNAFTIDAATHSTADGSGTIGWHYDIADSALDFLGANDQVQLTYTVQTDDGHGGTASQNVTITVHGTEDAPVITQATSGSFAEQAGTNNAGNDTASGSISFTDVDLSDRPTVTAPFDHYSYLAADGITALTLSPTQATALETALAIVPDGGNANDGSATWTYTVADNALDFLAQNETLTLTYLATVDDGQTGGVVTTPITVTITGTNDAPIITSSAVTGALQEDGVQSHSNTLAATDADHNAVLTWSVADSGAVIGTCADYSFDINNLKIVKDSNDCSTTTSIAARRRRRPAAATSTAAGQLQRQRPVVQRERPEHLPCRERGHATLSRPTVVASTSLAIADRSVDSAIR